MEKTFRKLLYLLTFLGVCAMVLVSCDNDDNVQNNGRKNKSIVILYENDVHCNIEGYPLMRGLRDAIVASDTSYVAMVNSGDYLQGGVAGAISHGQYIIDLMKNMGYDAVALGNHEFDYGIQRMQELMKQMDAPIVCANLYQYGGTTPMYHPYVIRQYGNKRIAFVGITTPETMLSESYSFYDNNQNQIYDLRTDDCYALVQQAVDNARREGADHVVVLAHLGEDVSVTGVDSHGLVAATRGIDAVLDGHTHSVIVCDKVANLDGELIPISQTGTRYANVGKLWLSPEGKFYTSLVPNEELRYANPNILHTVDSIKSLMQTMTETQVAVTAFDLIAVDGSNWFVRCEETAIGNLLSDTYRTILGAQIGMVNGGGIRGNLKAPTITYGDIIGVQPNDNYLVLLEATGAQIVDVLTRGSANYPQPEGSFPQVSGLRYTLHTDSHQVSDVEVEIGREPSILNTDRPKAVYEPIDPEAKYTIAMTDYCYNGGGFYKLFANCRVIKVSEMLCRDALKIYLEYTLGGVVPAWYAQKEGRITVVK